MLTFNEYKNKVKEYEDAIEAIKLNILYRKIELVGAQKREGIVDGLAFATSACINIGSSNAEECRKTEILNNDKTLSDLKLTLSTLERELDYIKYRAEIPIYIYSINKTEDKPQTGKKMSKRDILSRNAALNAARRARYGTNNTEDEPQM